MTGTDEMKIMKLQARNTMFSSLVAPYSADIASFNTKCGFCSSCCSSRKTIVKARFNKVKQLFYLPRFAIQFALC